MVRFPEPTLEFSWILCLQVKILPGSWMIKHKLHAVSAGRDIAALPVLGI